MDEAKALVDKLFETWGAGLFNGPDAYVCDHTGTSKRYYTTRHVFLEEKRWRD